MFIKLLNLLLGLLPVSISGLLIFPALGLDYVQHGRPVQYDFPIREYSVIITKEGYYPKSILAFEGERIRFFITSTTELPSCFSMPDKNIFLAVQKGKVAETEVYFSAGGEFEFFCPTGKIKGRVSVIKRERKYNQPVSKSENKNIHSKNSYNSDAGSRALAASAWMPKD
ncbi:MAG TPA: hypothetical protein VI754_05020 [Bacteriovoracaceae bacterium]|nr:hypothetical protein [Bacteriovoracaceae bacterium]